MRIGIPKEIKNHEYRVSVTPSGVHQLILHGHAVFVEVGAGVESGFSDQEYMDAGATMCNAADAWQQEMVVKVKEPLPAEYGYFYPGLLLFTFLHLAGDELLTKALLEFKVTAIAYETIENERRQLPLLIPMSEVAGRRSVFVANMLLEKYHGGKGLLLGGVCGTPRGKVVIVGAGTAGLSAAKVAYGIGCHVTMLDVSLQRLHEIDDMYKGRIDTRFATEFNISQEMKDADVVISTVLIPGAKAPKIIKTYMVQQMRKGSVIVDVAIDQGGSVESVDRITTHDHPSFEKYGIIHYSVANMPGATPIVSTMALSNATLPYILKLADDKLVACYRDYNFLKGVNTLDGQVTYKAVAEAFNMPYVSLENH